MTQFHVEVVTLFFNDERLRFRAVVIPDKHSLDHEALDQYHDTWYYKMYFVLLKQLLDPTSK